MNKEGGGQVTARFFIMLVFFGVMFIAIMLGTALSYLDERAWRKRRYKKLMREKRTNFALSRLDYMLTRDRKEISDG